MQSSCEIPQMPGPTRTQSVVLRFQPAVDPTQPFRWLGVPISSYKADASHHQGVSRTVLAGECGEKMAFHVRYFEVAPGGFSSLEKHAHEHVVLVLRGRGEITLEGVVHQLAFGDTVYVCPQAVHQLRNVSAEEPFGFLCLVDAQRDRPVLIEST